MTPSATIIIPCYNASPWLRETLDSAIRQTVPAEVILVDDGSTDDSAAIARSYGSSVRVMQQPNQGESVAMNSALAVAKGEYIVFQGADDVLAPNLIEAQLRAIEGVPKGVACTGCALFFDDTTKPFNQMMPSEKTFLPGIISGNLAPPSCWMYPKELILQAGCFHAPQKYFEDWDLNWRVALTGATFVPVPVVGFYYRQHAKSQLASLARAERAYGHAWVMERMCRAFLERDDLLQSYGEHLFWTAWASLRACRACGVSWDKLRLLCNMLDEVAMRRPPSLEGSNFARAVRLIGVRRTETVNSLLKGKGDVPSYRPAWMTPGAQATTPEAAKSAG